MAQGTLTVVVEDAKGKSAQTRIPFVNDADLDKAEDFANFIETHSDAKVTSYGISMEYEGTIDEGDYDMVKQKLKMLMRRTDITGNRHSLSIPAPRDEDVDTYQQATSDFAEDFLDFMELVTGSRPDYHGGALASKLPGSGELSRETTGI
jgi:hypothetical protein